MAPYAFDLIDEAGTISSVNLGEFSSDADAVRQGRQALVGSFTALALDIWCEGRHIARLRRTGPDGDPWIEQVDAPAIWNIVAPDASEDRTV